MVELTAGCLNCEINGKSIDVKDLIEMDWDDDLILLQVCQEARD
jgi:hypothetical protein